MPSTDSEGGQTPFANAFSQAVERRGVSLAWLQQRLGALGTPVSLATLSYWRSGRSQPEHATSLDALSVLDDLLYLPPGHLKSQLSPSRRQGPRRKVRTYGELHQDIRPARSLIQTMGYAPESPVLLEESTMHLTLDVDDNKWGGLMHCRSVWRALAPDARGHPDVIELENPQDGPPEFAAVSGCSLGQTHFDSEQGVYAYELLLDRQLGVGETAVTEYTLAFPGKAQIDTFFSQDLTWKVSELVLWVRFHPQMLPISCEAYVEDPAGATIARPLSLSGTTSAHHVVNNFGPAVVGIRWNW